MKDIIDILNENRGVIAIIAVVVSILLKYFEISFLKKNLQLRYHFSPQQKKGEHYVNYLVIWNSGKTTIKDEDFPALGKIKILTTTINEINISVEKKSNKYISTLQNNLNEKILEFDFMPKLDGIIYKITTSEKTEFSIEGKPIDGPKIKESNPNFWHKINIGFNLFVTILIFIGGNLGLAFLGEYLDWDTSYKGEDVGKYFLLFYLNGFILLAWAIYIVTKKETIYSVSSEYIEKSCD